MKMSFNYKLTQDFIRVLSETEMTLGIANRGNLILLIGYTVDGRPGNLYRETRDNPDSRKSDHPPPG